MAAVPGGALVYYSVEEVEALARALADDRHREASASEQEREARRAEDQQDGEVVRVSAYAGLRLGELLALRWRDVDFAGHALTVGRAMSAGVPRAVAIQPAPQAPDTVDHNGAGP